MKKFLIFICAIGIISSCKKEESKPEEPTIPTPSNLSCKLLNRQNDAGMTYKAYEYDSQGRLTKIQDYNSGVIDPTDFQTYEYTSNEVNVFNEAHSLMVKCVLNSNGYIATEYGSDGDTTYFEYNSEGYILNETTHTGGSGPHSINRIDYTVSGGNIIKQERFSDNILYSTYDYEFYSDKLCKNDLESNYQLGSIYLRGKKNKNLIKKIINTQPSMAPEVYEYTYESNESGYVTKRTETQSSSSYVARYTYSCN